ncbi:hypothetical protein Trydic_g7636 [Trypoxylus dichotomus]
MLTCMDKNINLEINALRAMKFRRRSWYIGLLVAEEHTDDGIVEEYVTTSTDRIDSEDEADHASASLGTERKLSPKKQEVINALEGFLKFSAASNQSIIDKIYELEKWVQYAKTEFSCKWEK